MHKLLLPIIMAAAAPASATGYPTADIVRTVVQCMADNGGISEETLYSCACRLDVIASMMTFDEYDHAVTFERLREMPGERGAVIRDVQEKEAIDKKLVAARKAAEEQCPLVRHIEPRKPN